MVKKKKNRMNITIVVCIRDGVRKNIIKQNRNMKL